MNINLTKLLNNEIPQIHEPSLAEQLKDYGILQYVKYNDGGIHFNLIDAKDDIDLEAIKQIILNHDSNKGEIEAENSKIIEARKSRYEKEIDGLVLEKIRLNFPDLFKDENKLVEKIKKELPKKA